MRRTHRERSSTDGSGGGGCNKWRRERVPGSTNFQRRRACIERQRREGPAEASAGSQPCRREMRRGWRGAAGRGRAPVEERASRSRRCLYFGGGGRAGADWGRRRGGTRAIRIRRLEKYSLHPKLYKYILKILKSQSIFTFDQNYKEKY